MPDLIHIRSYFLEQPPALDDVQESTLCGKRRPARNMASALPVKYVTCPHCIVKGLRLLSDAEYDIAHPKDSRAMQEAATRAGTLRGLFRPHSDDRKARSHRQGRIG